MNPVRMFFEQGQWLEHEPRLELALPVIHPMHTGLVAVALGLADEDVRDIISGRAALVGGVLNRGDRYTAIFDANTGVQALARIDGAKPFIVESLPIEAERLEQLRASSIDPEHVDRTLQGYLAVAIASQHAASVAHEGDGDVNLMHTEAGAHLQDMFEELVLVRTKHVPFANWCSLEELLLEARVASEIGEPPCPSVVMCAASEVGQCMSATVMDGDLLVDFPFCTLVLTADGEVRDAFRSTDLALLRNEQGVLAFRWSDERSHTVFGYLRDTHARAWVAPREPATFLVAMSTRKRWPHRQALVADLAANRGYVLNPFGYEDDVLLCAAGRYALDYGQNESGEAIDQVGLFIVEMASGQVVRDVRWLSKLLEYGNDLRSFARRADGSFIFCTTNGVVDDNGTTLFETKTGRMSLDAHGEHVLVARDDSVDFVALASKEVRTLLLRDVIPALVPANIGEVEVLLPLLAAFGTPRWIAAQPLPRLREALQTVWGAPECSDEELAAIVRACRECPPLPARIPYGSLASSRPGTRKAG